MTRLVEGTTLDGRKIMVETDFLPGDYLKPLKEDQIKSVSTKRLLKEVKALALEIDNSRYSLTLKEQKMLRAIEEEIIQRTTK
jgi:hypothetical protein